MQVYLETARLVLRRFTRDDLDDLVELNSDPGVMRFINGGIPTPRNMVERTILPGYLAEYQRHPDFGHWAAIERRSGAFLGYLGLELEEGRARGDAALGYRMRSSVWGKGYATEGARAVIRKAFTELGVERVIAVTYEENLASRRVMEKLGMRLVRTFRMTADDLLADGNYYPSLDLWDGDDVEYALERREWAELDRA
jgi:RimJ/RimL family protein N-acetyltransferase